MAQGSLAETASASVSMEPGSLAAMASALASMEWGSQAVMASVLLAQATAVASPAGSLVEMGTAWVAPVQAEKVWAAAV
jgi:hypothetical protein